MPVKNISLPLTNFIAIIVAAVSFHTYWSERFERINAQFNGLDLKLNSLASDILVKDATIRAWAAGRERTEQAISEMRETLTVVRKDLQTMHDHNHKQP